MVAKNHTVLLYSKIDSIEFIKKFYSLKFKRIYVLTPDSYAVIKNKVDENLIVFPSKIFTKSHHKKIINTVKLFQKSFFQALTKSEFRNYEKEILKHLIHFTMSSAFYLWYSIEKFGPWLVFDGKEWRYIFDKKKAYETFYRRIYTTMQPNYFGQIPNYKKKYTYIFKLINNISIKLFKNHQSIWLTGDQYRMKEISREITNQKKDTTIFYLQPLQKYTFYKTVLHFTYNLLKYISGKRVNEIFLTPIVEGGVSRNNNLKKLFAIKNFSPVNKVFDIIIKNFSYILDYLQSIERSVENLVISTNPKLLISHQLKVGDAVLLGSYFKDNNIPVTLISHGSHPVNNDSYANFELKDNLEGLMVSNFATSTVAQSKIALKSFKKSKSTCKLICSQPIMYGASKNYRKKRNKSKVFTILHAGTPKPLGTRPYIYETSFEYLSGLLALAKNISEISDVKLIIRFRPAAEFSSETIHLLLPKYKNVELVHGGNFYEDLEKSDMLMSFASTTIEESLYQRKPVGLYGANSRFWHIDGSKKPPTLKKRSSVYHISEKNLKHMITQIKKYHFKKPLIDEELKKYIWGREEMGFKKFIKSQIKN